VTDIAARYEKFQAQAVQNILEDFRGNPKGRFLLVIPTGGGKTMTAVKALSALYADGVLEHSERLIWVVHRVELRTQALEAFTAFQTSNGGAIDLRLKVDVIMIGEIAAHLAKHPEVRFAVIDEAHHVAAASYQPIFARPAFGILGLTATPSRHDGQLLPFDRESYSIGFPDLVRMGVLLQPHVERVEGGRYDIEILTDGEDGLDVLNNQTRNQRILECLAEHADKLSKVIIYVGTQQHARDLFSLIRKAEFASRFHTLALVLGGNERRRVRTSTGAEAPKEERADFMAALKQSPSALIVNVDVLTEGYDDPSVNAVVMARPTKSKLVYMQAIGRAVRLDPQNLAKQAFVIEVVDELPNIRYRIDNRWLYSDVSDLLEPAVVDRFYTDKKQISTHLEAIFEAYRVPTEYRSLPEFSEHDRVTLLLFKVYVGPSAYEHLPLVITNATRQAASSFFNFVSLKMKQLQNQDIEMSLRPVARQCEFFPALSTAKGRKWAFFAMQNAFEQITRGSQAIESVVAGAPWVTFLAMRLELASQDLPSDLLEFTEDMFNKENVREALRADSISPEFALVKFPLPLAGSVGIFLASAEMSALIATVDHLREHAREEDALKQWSLATSVIGTAALPIEKRYLDALPTIVRERLDYYRWLTPRHQEH
jgi:superfamily II DNA or RNA helicase